MTQKIKGVIFDLDGTLANTLPLCISAFRKAIEPLANRKLSDEEIVATFGPSEEGTVMALAPHAFEEGVAAYLQYYTELHDLCKAPFNGMVELLETLQDRNIRLAMVTGKGKYSAAVSLARFELTEFFEIVETGIKSGPSKPEGIQRVLQQWHFLNKDEVIYVGDAPSDIDACRKAGIAIVAAAWAETAEPEKLIPLKPDELFDKVEDFSNWLLQHTSTADN